MLFNTKWDVFSLKSLIAWLEKQPANKHYDWEKCDGTCLIGLYAAAHGVSWQQIITEDADGHSPYERLTPGGLAYLSPRTFGAALKRARKFAEPTP